MGGHKQAPNVYQKFHFTNKLKPKITSLQKDRILRNLFKQEEQPFPLKYKKRK